MVVPVGKANEDEPEFTKSKAVHRYLLQYEFQDTVMVFSSAGLHVLSAAKKVGFLTPLAAEAKKVGVNVTLLTRNKVDANKANFAAMVGAIKGSHGGAKVAGFLKEKASQTGAVCAGWAAAAAAAGLEAVEGAQGMASFLSVKAPVRERGAEGLCVCVFVCVYIWKGEGAGARGSYKLVV